MSLEEVLAAARRKQAQSPIGQARTAADSSRGQFGGLINEIVGRGRDMADAPGLTARDLFGDQLTRIEDSARQNANSLKSAIARSLMSGGGDVSGAAGTQLLNVGEATEEQIGQSGFDFARLAEQINRRNRSEGLGLLSQGLQGTQNLATFDRSILNTLIDRKVMKEQAKKNRRNNLFAAGINMVGSILGGGIGGGGGGGE